MNRLFIIGNGFDLAHHLPTSFNPNFKVIAEAMEQIPCFWDIYQSRESDIWSDFENCLAHPDFNELEKILDGYQPDYSSDHERDRNAIITQVDLNGNLTEALYEFAEQAEAELRNSSAQMPYVEMFNHSDLFVSFNYTHTLERLYGINPRRVLHIHGEVGTNNLLLGYLDGTFEPEKYSYDVRQKGRDPYIDVDIQAYIEDMLENEIDIYFYTAYKDLIAKTESFKKVPRIQELEQFLDGIDCTEIYVIGHSCAVDFPYFEYLNSRFDSPNWIFAAYNEATRNNILNLVSEISIKYCWIQKSKEEFSHVIYRSQL